MSPSDTLPAAPGPPAEAPAERWYAVGEAARITGLSDHTLRYYERARLIRPVRRERSSRHRYSAEDIGRLRTLACLRMQELRGHLEYLDRKIAYWRAVEAGDTRAAAEITDRLFQSFACSNPRAP